MRFAVTIVAPPGYPHVAAFFEVAEALQCGLKALGHEALVTTKTDMPGFRHIVLGSNLLVDYAQPLASDAVLYNLEQIQQGSPWMKPGLVDLFRKHTVWDYSERNAAALKKLGVTVEHVLPIGYVPELTRIEPSAVKDIDVLFFGSLNDRRRKIIDGFRSAGANIQAVFGAYGKKRDALIARSRLVLNVHYYEAKVLEMVRLQYLLANAIPVLSERSAEPQEDGALEGGVAFADYDSLVTTGMRLLANQPELDRLGKNGLVLMRERSQVDYLRAALGT